MNRYVVLIALSIITATPFIRPALQQAEPRKVGKKIFLDFTKDEIAVGSSSYEKVDEQNAKLITLEVEENQQNHGYGKEIFRQTMKAIHKKYPSIEIVTWDIWPFVVPEKLTYEEAEKMLFNFYRRVGATVDEEKKNGSINLKDAGYFDEN